MTDFTRKTGWEEVSSPAHGTYDTNVTNPAFMTVTKDATVGFSYKSASPVVVEFVANGSDVSVELPPTDTFKIYEIPFTVSAGTFLRFLAKPESLALLNIFTSKAVNYVGSPKVGINLSRVFGVTATQHGEFVAVTKSVQSGLDLVLPKATSVEILPSKGGTKIRYDGLTYTLPNAKVVLFPKKGQVILELNSAGWPTLVCCRDLYKPVDTDKEVMVPKFL